MCEKEEVKIVTRTRGFWNHLNESNYLNYSFILQKSYEVNSKKQSVLSRIARSSILDYLGIIQCIHCKDTDKKIVGSFNRFLDSEKPCFIYVENPTALYHYKLKRGKSYLGKKRIKYLSNNKNLKYIICMSHSCAVTFDSICFSTKDLDIRKETIYPLVPINRKINKDYIKNKSNDEVLKLLFIAQGVRLISKGLLNILETMNRLKDYKLELTILTEIDYIDENNKSFIESCPKIRIINFGLNYTEMEELYSKQHILLHPTSDDSSPLTVLEAMKSGLPILSTNLYAIPEMIDDTYNGFLTDPQWWFFDQNKYPNPDVWNHRKQTILSQKKDERMIMFLCDRIKLLYHDRNLLYSMSCNSLDKASMPPFSEEFICKQWNTILDDMKGYENE